MGKQVSYNSHDYTSVEVVPVIASFDSEGRIAPLYVRIDGTAYRVKSYWIKSSFANSVSFNCQVMDGDYLKPVLLTYFQDETLWTIPKR